MYNRTKAVSDDGLELHLQLRRSPSADSHLDQVKCELIRLLRIVGSASLSKLLPAWFMNIQRPEQHLIEDESKLIFKQKLPRAWVCNSQTKDYGIDYLITTGADGVVSGESFYVQLKGQLNAKYGSDKSHVLYRIDKKYAEYYLDKVRDLPVFIVVVDVTARMAWWIFVQPYLRRDQSWRNAESVLLRIPTTNELGNSAAFVAIVPEAKRLLRLTQAGSINEAIQAQQQEIRELDPRFVPTISVVDNRTTILLNPIEPVSVTFEFANSDTMQEKLRELFGKGKAVAFDPGQVSVKGTELFNRLTAEGAVIQVSTRINATGSLIAKNDGVETGRLDNIIGTLVGGHEELHFKGTAAGPIFGLDFGPLSNVGVGTLGISLNIESWRGKTVRRLPYFSALEPFYTALEANTAVHFVLYEEGNQVFDTWSPNGAGIDPNYGIVFRLLKKARRIFELIEIDPVFDNQILDRSTLRDIDELHDAVFESQYERITPNATLRFSIPFTSIEKFNRDIRADIRIESLYVFDILGTHVQLEANAIYTHMKVDSVEAAKDSENARIIMKGNADTRTIYQKQRPDCSPALFVGDENKLKKVVR